MTALTLALAALLAPPIEGAEHLDGLFAALAAREADPSRGRVRITHLGDSHVAADLWTGPIRASLQARFGDGGRGFVLPGRPWRSYWQSHLDAATEGDWRVDGLGRRFDGHEGPGLCSLASADPRAVVEVSTPEAPEAGRAFSRLAVHYLAEPGGGCLVVEVPGHLRRRVSTRAAWMTPRVARFELPDGPHEVTLRPGGSGEARLLGVDMIRSTGLIYDALGINGARADRLLRARFQGLAAVLGALEPDLMVLSYGANELFDPDLDLTAHALALERVIDRLRAAAPRADCLLTAPPDMLRRGRPIPSADALRETTRRIAGSKGCAWWDARAAMGGPGSVRRWARAGMAARDGVHLTRAGYEALADAFVGSLREAFEDGRRRSFR